MVEPDGFLRFHTGTGTNALLPPGDDSIPYRNQYTGGPADYADNRLSSLCMGIQDQ